MGSLGCGILKDRSHVLYTSTPCIWGFPGGSVVKNLPANGGDTGSIPGLGRSLEKEMATHSRRILAWEISWTEEPGGLQSVESNMT